MHILVKENSVALETLKGVGEIGGFSVGQYSDYSGLVEALKAGSYILVDHENSKISFCIQNGPIKENGVNGCQVDTLLEAAKIIISKLNERFPCEENEGAVAYINSALDCLAARKKNREARGVEGTSQA